MNTETDLWVAKRGAMITMDGTRVAVGRGDAARDGHPVLAAAPGLFARLSVRFDAEPGAGTAVTPPQRSPGRPRKTAAAAQGEGD